VLDPDGPHPRPDGVVSYPLRHLKSRLRGTRITRVVADFPCFPFVGQDLRETPPRPLPQTALPTANTARTASRRCLHQKQHNQCQTRPPEVLTPREDVRPKVPTTATVARHLTDASVAHQPSEAHRPTPHCRIDLYEIKARLERETGMGARFRAILGPPTVRSRVLSQPLGVDPPAWGRLFLGDAKVLAFLRGSGSLRSGCHGLRPP